MPVGAFGGRKDIMDAIAPLGGVYQAGTLSGNPIAVAAGITTLKLLDDAAFYEQLSAQTAKLAKGLEAAAKDAGVSLRTDHVGGMLGLYFSDSIPTSFTEVSASNTAKFNAFFHAMLNEGVYWAPSAFEASFTSGAHDDTVINTTLEIAAKVFSKIKT